MFRRFFRRKRERCVSGDEMRRSYGALELSWEADRQAIKSQYRRLALRYHPDRNPGDPWAEERFKAITSAYRTLQQAFA